MSKANKTIKGPLTEGFLLADIRRKDLSFRLGSYRSHAARSVLTVLTAVLLVFSFTMAGLPTANRSVKADSKENKSRRSTMSPDLEDQIVRSPNDPVRVIIDTKSSTNSSAFGKLLARVATMGGVVLRNLNNGKSVSVEISARAVQALSTDNAVKFISLDRTTQRGQFEGKLSRESVMTVPKRIRQKASI